MNSDIFNKCISIKYHSDGTHYLKLLRSFGYAVFLDSNANKTNERYDIITSKPRSLIACSQEKKISNVLNTNDIDVDLDIAIFDINACDNKIFDAIEEKILMYTTKNFKYKNLPFCSGAIGIFSYDYCLKLHKELNDTTKDWPILFIGIYQWSIIQDHKLKKSWLVCDPKLDVKNFELIKKRIIDQNQFKYQSSFEITSEWKGLSSFKKYEEAFDAAKEYIYSGDCYQINLAQEFNNDYSGDPLHAYEKLRDQSPTPFAAFIEIPCGSILSMSPERFIKIKKGIVTTTPIKGTHKRGSNPTEDALYKNKLSCSIKNRAENLMIVDLMRNDLGMDCKIGSISTPELFYIETYENVHHMVSKVTAEIEYYDVKSSLKLLKNCLPGGSITGAPKKRSMEIIDELEDFDRSIYCGTIATISNDGELDSNILIRSFLLTKSEGNKGKINCWGGGGIVADSEVDSEYNECFHKINNIINAIS